MKKISFWAREHKWLSRILIVLGFVALNATGIVTGILLKDIGVIFSSFVFLSIIIFYLFGILIYPLRSQSSRSAGSRFYKKQKTADVILAASAFLMIVYLSNRPDSLFRFEALSSKGAISSSLPKDSAATYKPISAFSASLKDKDGKSLKWKEKKKLLKEQIKGIKKAKDMSEGGKVGLIVLSVVVALGLIYLLAALSCSLSCNGSDAAALLVGVGGLALIIFLFIITMKAINHKNKKRKVSEEKISPAG
ncbi:MAG: hypothetical protein ABUT20_35300 [Bacteroidota bacterium]